jgi:hypothetical protein
MGSPPKGCYGLFCVAPSAFRGFMCSHSPKVLRLSFVRPHRAAAICCVTPYRVLRLILRGLIGRPRLDMLSHPPRVLRLKLNLRGPIGRPRLYAWSPKGCYGLFLRGPIGRPLFDA